MTELAWILNLIFALLFISLWFYLKRMTIIYNNNFKSLLREIRRIERLAKKISDT